MARARHRRRCLRLQGRRARQPRDLAKPRGSEWRIERLQLANADGTIAADGAWRGSGPAQQTKLDVALDVRDAAGFLGRLGFPAAVQGAPTRINGQLAWSGAPNAFDYPTLAGTFRVDVGPVASPARAGHRQAAGRAFAAGAATSHHPRLPRRVQRGLRLRPDQRAPCASSAASSPPTT
ncbi:MAG: AsmA-like C-terminal region-containing protein [Betaproteobacteria bacterium]|nr:AsmA-like C-terminal region-containing protein [Betaproteobacteria bacterium]